MKHTYTFIWPYVLQESCEKQKKQRHENTHISLMQLCIQHMYDKIHEIDATANNHYNN